MFCVVSHVVQLEHLESDWRIFLHGDIGFPCDIVVVPLEKVLIRPRFSGRPVIDAPEIKDNYCSNYIIYIPAILNAL